MSDWERVTIGQSGAVASRRDGVYRKEGARDLARPGRRPHAQYGPKATFRYLARCGIAPDPAKIAFYRLLDNF